MLADCGRAESQLTCPGWWNNDKRLQVQSSICQVRKQYWQTRNVVIKELSKGQLSRVFVFVLFILLQMSPFPPTLFHMPLTLALIPPGHHHTIVWVYGLCTYKCVLWLILSPSFIQSSPQPLLLSDSCQFVPGVYASLSVLFVRRNRQMIVSFSNQPHH